MSAKEKERTGPGVSDPQGPAGVGGIVPAPSPSSSDVGPPPGFTDSPGGEMAISVMAKGLAKALSADKRKVAEGSARKSTESGPGAQASPAPATPGPSRSREAADEVLFARPGPLSSKKKKAAAVVDITDGDSSSDDVSVSGEMTPFSDMSSDTNYALAHGGQVRPKRSRGRPATTGEWVGVEAVRRDLELLKKELAEVKAERDVLAGRLEVTLGATPGGIPSVDAMMGELGGESLGSLINVVMDEMAAVDRVAVRSGSLKGTFVGVLRAAARRATAASKVLFARATTRSDEDGGDIDRVRCDLVAARALVDEAQERARRAEEEVKLYQAKETLQRARAGRVSPPPRRLASLSGMGGEAMEVEELPGGSPPREIPPPVEAIPEGLPPTQDPPLPLDIERIVEGVLERLKPQLGPLGQSPAPPREVPWSKVVGRKAKKGAAPKQPPKEAAPLPPPPIPGGKKKKKGKRKGGPAKDPSGGRAPAAKAGPAPQKGKRTVAGVVREPRTAAVHVTVAPGSEATLASVLKESRPLADGIPGFSRVTTRLKRSQAGGLLIQIPGEEGPRLADALAAEMQRVVGVKEGVRVARPMKRAELRIHGLDDSITREELLDSVAGLADCPVESLKLGEIKFLPSRLGSAWLRCPVAASNKLLETGKWRIGWAEVTAKPLPARRMRCFRCLEVGHTQANCRGDDRSGRCHRCGDRSHTARECKAGGPKCPLCVDFGLPAEHALGAVACVPNARAARRKKEMGARKPPTEGTGGGSRGGPRRAEPPEPSAPAGPAGQGRTTRSGASLCRPEKGSSAVGGARVPPSEGVGGGSKGGPRRAKPPETPAPAGPAEEEEETRPDEDMGLPSTSEKGSIVDGGDRPGKSSLKRTASDRSPAIQRRTEEERREEGEKRTEESPPPPPPALKKRRDRKGRFKTR